VEICGHAREAGAWTHVDGAFGLWARSVPARAALAEGVDGADSWATDAHKWLNTPYDCGVALLREPHYLEEAMSVAAPYFRAGDGPSPGRMTPDSSRRARGIEVWAALRSLGRRGAADLVERTCRHARRFAEGFRAAGLEVLNDVVLNQVVVAVGRDGAEAECVAEAIQREGTCWVGPTRWQDRPALRVSVSSWRTTEEDVDRSLAAILAAVRDAKASRA
jgi:glutamate/tyrosine decarboxylase-like PLP-dependent enzyme